MYYWFNMLQNIKYRKIYGYQLNFVMGYNVLTKEKTIMNLTNIFESTDFVRQWHEGRTTGCGIFERTVRGTGSDGEDRGFSGCYGGY